VALGLRLIFCILAALACAGAKGAQAIDVPPARSAEPLVPEVRVDDRIELLAIIFRLAGAPEYGFRFVPLYADAVDSHFSSLREHPAVLSAMALRASDNVGYNAIVDLAVYLGPLPDLRERAPLDGSQIDPRWKPESARQFLELVRAFAIDSDAAAFFARQRPLYSVAERRMRALIAHETDLRWVKDFYGGTGRETFIVVPAPLNGQVAYGSRFYGARDRVSSTPPSTSCRWTRTASPPSASGPRRFSSMNSAMHTSRL